jgi:hypothetical protein
MRLWRGLLLIGLMSCLFLSSGALAEENTDLVFLNIPVHTYYLSSPIEGVSVSFYCTDGGDWGNLYSLTTNSAGAGSVYLAEGCVYEITYYKSGSPIDGYVYVGGTSLILVDPTDSVNLYLSKAQVATPTPGPTVTPSPTPTPLRRSSPRCRRRPAPARRGRPSPARTAGMRGWPWRSPS